MGYRSTESDPDVWLKRAMKPSGEEYFKYIFVYVDRILYWSHDKRQDIHGQNHLYILKQLNIAAPERLGANAENIPMQNGKECWSMHCVDYLQGAINNVQDILSKDHGGCIK